MMDELRMRRFGTYVHRYTQRDLIVYALGLGCTAAEDLPFVYEGWAATQPLPNAMGLDHLPRTDQWAVMSEPGRFIVESAGRGSTAEEVMLRPSLGQAVSVIPFPTFGIVAAHPAIQGIPLETYIPGFDKNKALHGEQYMQLFAPIPASGELRTKPQIVDIRDKGKGAVVVVRTETVDALTGVMIALNEFTIFALGTGGFGTPWPAAARPAGATRESTPPSRPPDAQASAKTSEEQATLYRLSGDWNPLHIDPRAAKAAGFQRPILHGLCSLGIATKLLVKEVAGGDATRVRSVKARFARVVFPGETLSVSIWKDDSSSSSSKGGGGSSTPTPTPTTTSMGSSMGAASGSLQRYVFEARVEGRLVLSNAAVELAEGASTWAGQQRVAGLLASRL